MTTLTIKTDRQILEKWRETALDDWLMEGITPLEWKWRGDTLYLFADPQDRGLGLERLCRDLVREVRALEIQSILSICWGQAEGISPMPVFMVNIPEAE